MFIRCILLKWKALNTPKFTILLLKSQTLDKKSNKMMIEM